MLLGQGIIIEIDVFPTLKCLYVAERYGFIKVRKPSDKNKIRGFVQLIILIISYLKMTYASVKMCVTEYLSQMGFTTSLA